MRCIGALELGRMSVTKHTTPPGGQRGRVLSRSGTGSVLDAGSEVRTSRTVKAEAWGPNGSEGVNSESEAKTDVPSSVWVVRTSRGAGSSGVAMKYTNVKPGRYLGRHLKFGAIGHPQVWVWRPTRLIFVSPSDS